MKLDLTPPSPNMIYVYDWGYRQDVYIRGRSYEGITQASYDRLIYILDAPVGFGNGVLHFTEPEDVGTAPRSGQFRGRAAGTQDYPE